MNSAVDPPLPTIDDLDLLLDIHTHRTLRLPALSDSKWGDTERLADLGAKALDAVVTYHLFEKRPCLSADEIATERARCTSAVMLNSWLDYYHLKQKLRVPPNESDAILSDLEEMKIYFHTYVGALYATKGFLPVQIWISRLIDPNSNPEHYPAVTPAVTPAATPAATPVTQQSGQDGRGFAGYGYRNPLSSTQNQNYSSSFATTSYSVPAPPAGIPPPLPSSPPIPASINLIPLALVHQVAVQKGFSINYAAFQDGPPHQPTWTVQCLVNNVERGSGTAKSQKLAKEEAARKAWISMGWP